MGPRDRRDDRSLGEERLGLAPPLSNEVELLDDTLLAPGLSVSLDVELSRGDALTILPLASPLIPLTDCWEELGEGTGVEPPDIVGIEDWILETLLVLLLPLSDSLLLPAVGGAVISPGGVL